MAVKLIWLFLALGGPQIVVHVGRRFGALAGSVAFAVCGILLFFSYKSAIQDFWEIFREYPVLTPIWVILVIVFSWLYFLADQQGPAISPSLARTEYTFKLPAVSNKASLAAARLMLGIVIGAASSFAALVAAGALVFYLLSFDSAGAFGQSLRRGLGIAPLDGVLDCWALIIGMRVCSSTAKKVSFQLAWAVSLLVLFLCAATWPSFFFGNSISLIPVAFVTPVLFHYFFDRNTDFEKYSWSPGRTYSSEARNQILGSLIGLSFAMDGAFSPNIIGLIKCLLSGFGLAMLFRLDYRIFAAQFDYLKSEDADPNLPQLIILSVIEASGILLSVGGVINFVSMLPGSLSLK